MPNYNASTGHDQLLKNPNPCTPPRRTTRLHRRSLPEKTKETMGTEFVQRQFKGPQWGTTAQTPLHGHFPNCKPERKSVQRQYAQTPLHGHFPNCKPESKSVNVSHKNEHISFLAPVQSQSQMQIPFQN
jgi:hypothetical protein